MISRLLCNITLSRSVFFKQTMITCLVSCTLFVFDSSGQDFKNIKDVLKNDNLEKIYQKKQKIKKTRVKQSKKELLKKYDTPEKSEFLNYFSEYWLVKNAQTLQWNFEKPDYGIAEAFKDLLQKLGHVAIQFKVLVVNAPSLPHMALPGHTDRPILIISLPFMRTLDLTKEEIALLLLQDFYLLKNGHFEDKVYMKELDGILNGNFYKKKIDSTLFKKLYDGYNQFIYQDGFKFNQIYEVTKKMDRILKTDLVMWNKYYNLTKKINELVKSNSLYSFYPKIYPSPELQIQWLAKE